MPKIKVTIPEVEQSVTRPIVLDIIKQVQTMLQMDPSIKIFYPGDIQKMKSPGTNIEAHNDKFAFFNTNRYNFIEVDENYDKGSLGSTAVGRTEHIPIFVDSSTGVVVKPIYATTNVVINFNFRCPSKTEAIRWKDDIRIKVSTLRDINLHNITYHYPLPLEIVYLLQAVHANREDTEPYNEDLKTYIFNNSTDRLTVVGDLVNNDNGLAVAETQMRIIGMYDWEGIPEKLERDDQNGTWDIKFSYKFSYEKPIGLHASYPIMIHNKLLPNDLIEFTNKEFRLSQVEQSRTHSLNALGRFEQDTIINRVLDEGFVLRFPDVDDFVCPSVPTGTGTLFTVLSEVDEVNKKSLFNLADLDTHTLDKYVEQFIRESEYPYIGQFYKSIIMLNLFRNNNLTSSGSLVCASNLDVSSPVELNLRHRHHVRFSLVADLTLLDKAALDRLRKYPKAAVVIISAINKILKNNPDFVKLGDKKELSVKDLDDLLIVLTGFGYDKNINWTATEAGNYKNGLNPISPRRYAPNPFIGIDARLAAIYKFNSVVYDQEALAGIIRVVTPSLIGE